MQHYGIYDLKWTRSLDHHHPISQSSHQTLQPSLIIKSSSTTGCKRLRVNGRQVHWGVCLNLGPWRCLTITTSLHFSPEWCGNQCGPGYYKPLIWRIGPLEARNIDDSSVCDNFSSGDDIMTISRWYASLDWGWTKMRERELSWLSTWKHCSTLVIWSKIRALNINKSKLSSQSLVNVGTLSELEL